MGSVSFTLTGVSVGSEIRRIPHSGNARLHWAQRARWNRAWKEAAGWYATSTRNGTRIGRIVALENAAKREVTITLHCIRQLDPDNAYAAAKPIVDGLKGILIADDSPEHIRLVVRQLRVSKRAEERVEVEVGAMGEKAA